MNEYKILNDLRDKMVNRPDKDTLRFNMGAVLLSKSGTVLSLGLNSYTKSHPRIVLNPNYNEFKLYLHAECAAIYKNHKDNKPYAMIIARLGEDNEFRLAKPCLGCYSEIKAIPTIKRVYYTNSEGGLILMDLKVSIEDYAQ
jgi:deoxycytidylate deaminase